MRKRVQQKGLSKLGQFINDNPNVELRVLLDQDELLDSKQNQRLFGEFVTKTPERFWEMLQIINIRPNKNEEAIPNKYPFLVSEIIGSKEEQIINYFFDQNGPEEFEFLNMLFKTIDRDYIDNTLAGYMSKILKAIIDKRGLSLWKYLINTQKESQYVLKDLIKHLDVQNIADIIFYLIQLDTIRVEGEYLYLNERLQLLSRVIDYLQQKNNIGVIVENVSQILQNILTETNENEERSQFIFYILNSTLKYDSILISKSNQLIKLLIIILEYIQRENVIGKNIITYNYSLIQEISNNLAELLNLDLNLPPFKTSYGINQEPLGQFKLQLIEFYLKVLKINEPNIMPYFNHQNIYCAIMQLIIKHEFNNPIQNLLLEITQLVMKNYEYYEIQQEYKNANIVGFLIYLNTQERYQVGSINKSITKGYQGMANKLSFMLQNDFSDENWNIYIQRQQQIFHNENTYLLDQNPNYIEDEKKQDELIQSLTFNQNKEPSALQFGQVEISKMQTVEQDLQQQPIQSVISPQLEEVQQKLIITQPNSEILMPNTDIQQSNLRFGQIDQIIQPQEDNINPDDQNTQSIQNEDEQKNIIEEIKQVLQVNEYKDPDQQDKIVLDFTIKKLKSDIKSKSAIFEENYFGDRPRRCTISHIPSQKKNSIQRKSSDQTFETDNTLQLKLSTPKNNKPNQSFSPLLQIQQDKDRKNNLK